MKRLTIVCALLALSLGVTACGGSPNSTVAPTDDDTTAETVAAETTADATETSTEQASAPAPRLLTLTEVGSIKEFKNLQYGMPLDNDAKQYYTVNGDPIGVYDYLSVINDYTVFKSASGEKFGLVSPTDGELLPCEYTDITELSNRFCLVNGGDGLQVYDMEEKQFVPDLKPKASDKVQATNDLVFVGETIYAADGSEFGTASKPDANDYSYVARGTAGEHVAYSSDGTKLFFMDANMYPLSGTGDFFLINPGDGYGIVDSEGNTIVQPEYENISTNHSGGNSLNDGCVCVQKGGLWGMIDLNGNVIHDFTATTDREYCGGGVFRVEVEDGLDTYWNVNGGSYTIKPSAGGNTADIVSADGQKVQVTGRSYNTFYAGDGDGLVYFNWNTGKMDIHAADNKGYNYDLDTNIRTIEGDLLAIPTENGEYTIYDVFCGEPIWSGTAYAVAGSHRFVYIYDGNTETYTVYRIDYA